MSDHPAAPVLDDGQLVQLAELLAPQVAAELAPRLARAIAELQDAQPQREEWLTPAATADRFAVTTDWLYRHADELGVLRLGDGPKARLRFDPQKVEEALTPSVAGNGSEPAEAPPPVGKSPRRRRTAGAGAGRVPELLPIRGREE